MIYDKLNLGKLRHEYRHLKNLPLPFVGGMGGRKPVTKSADYMTF